jgi:hypothetical protein
MEPAISTMQMVTKTALRRRIRYSTLAISFAHVLVGEPVTASPGHAPARLFPVIRRGLLYFYVRLAAPPSIMTLFAGVIAVGHHPGAPAP